MNVYVESNFILEIALEQEQHLSCNAIANLCEQEKIQLFIPAFSFAEPHETLVKRMKERKILNNKLILEIQQLARSRPYKEMINTLQQVTGLLVQSIEDDSLRLLNVLKKLLSITNTISLNNKILSSAIQFQDIYELSPQDAIVYASIFDHVSLDNNKGCFINKNFRDFDDPDIITSLEKYNCKMLYNFDNGYQYISNKINN